MERLSFAGRRLSAARFDAELSELAATLRREIESAVDGFDTDEAARDARRGQARESLRFFARTYFPHYRQCDAEAASHTWVYDHLPARIDADAGTRSCLAAPRGEGKSTVVSLQLLLWCLLTARKHFIILVSDTAAQAMLLLACVKAELDTNPRLLSDWPDETGPGPVWRDGEIVTPANRMVLTRGSGQRIRGLRHGPRRPDLVIGDDLENDQSVVRLEQRRKTERWWRDAVLHAGPADRTLDVVVVGTVLHHDGLLVKLLESGLWRGARFEAVPAWPHDGDRWDAFAEIANAEGEDAARAYYTAHRAEMDAGAALSWPGMQDLVGLMIEWAEDPIGFAKEKQNRPSAGDDAIFSGALRFWTKPPAPMLTFGALDPSLGRLGAGTDPSAILVGGVPIGAGVRRVLHVLHAAIRRRTPDAMIDDVIELQRRFECLLWAVESTAFQEFLRTTLVERSAAAGVPVPARPVLPHTDKRLRIESLQPHVANGLILVHRSQATLVDQLEHYPHAAHDDGPDALHMLFTAAMAGARDPAGHMRSAPRPDVAPIPWERY